MAHPYQNYAGASPSQNAYFYYPASGNAHNQPMLYQPSEYLPGAGILVSSGLMAPAQEPAQAVTPRPRTRNPHYDLHGQTQQNYCQQAGSSYTAVPVPTPVMSSFGYHLPHPQSTSSTFHHSAFPAQPSQSIVVAPSDYTYTIEPALVPLSASAEQSTTQRRASVREPATRPARAGTLAPDSLLFQPFVPKFAPPEPAPQQPQPVVMDEVTEDDAWLQFLAQYPPSSLGF